MFPSWHFILIIIVFDSIFGHSAATNNKTHGVIKKHARVATRKGDLLLRKVNPESDSDFPGYGWEGNAERGDEDSGSGTDSNDAKYKLNKNVNDNYNERDSGSGTDSNDANYKMNKNDNDNDKDSGFSTDNNDSKNDDENNKNIANIVNLDAEDNADASKRPLEAGDTFTPTELLVVAQMLFEKAKDATKDSGIKPRGIVSGAKCPEEVADRIFKAFFLTDRRIVELKESDLHGLDALQTLSAEGRAVGTRSSGNSITERPLQTLNLNGQLILADERPLRCHYKLLFKKISPSEAILRRRPNNHMTPFPEVLKMEKKMRPNRNLVINHKGRKSRKNNNNNSSMNEDNNAVTEPKVEIVKKNARDQIKMTRQEVGKERKQKARKLKSKRKIKRQNKKGRNQTDFQVVQQLIWVARNNKSKKQRKSRKKKSKSNSTEKLKDLRNKNIDAQMPLTTTVRPACTWRYLCEIPEDLDTCRLHTSCIGDGNNQPMIDNNIVDTKDSDIRDRENTEQVKLFRRLSGTIDLDNQVEIIIGDHVKKVRPELLEIDERIETLEEYFNNIIQAQYTSTTPPPNSKEDNNEQEMHPLQDSESDDSEEMRKKILRRELSAEVLRNLDGETVKVKNTAFPNVGETQKFHSDSGSTASMTAVTSK